MIRRLAPASAQAAAALVVTVAGCGGAGDEAATQSGSTPPTDGTGQTSAPGSSPADPPDTSRPSEPASQPPPRDPSDDDRTLTPADHGATVDLRIGDVVELHISDPFAPEPRVDGKAIAVVETVNVSGTSGGEWEIRAVAPGTATLRGGSAGDRFAFTIRVRDDQG